MNPDAAYRHCARLTREAARNLYYGIRLLPQDKRRGLCAIYAFSRICDDAVDDFSGGEAQRQLQASRRLLEQAAAGEGAEDPVVFALGAAIRRYGLPMDAFAELLAGMEMDLAGAAYETLEDLLTYCRRVGGAVGRLCLAVFGYTVEQAPALADDMGVALQLTNILRDVREDLARGRIYLPGELLRRAGVSAGDLQARRLTGGLKEVLAELAGQAHRYYARAEGLFPLVAADARLCPMALHTIYRELLKQIQAQGYDVFGMRVRLSAARKLQLVGGLFWRAWREQADHG